MFNKKSLLMFSLYFFVFLLVESIINHNAAILLSANAVNYIYIVGLLFGVVGYLIYGCYPNYHRVAFIVTLVSIFPTIEANNVYINLISSCFSLTAIGYIGGYVHHLLARYVVEDDNAGKRIGIAAGIAVAFQFLYQNFNAPSWLLMIIVSVFCMLGFESKPIEQFNTKIECCCHNNLKVLMLAVFIMSVILSFNDSLMTYLDANNDVSLFSAVRLFYCLGLILSGIIYDIDEHKYFNLVTLCVMFLSVVSACFLTDPMFYNLNMSLMYFYSGFYVMFLTIGFADLSATKHTILESRD